MILQVLLAMRANVEDRGMKGDCTPLMEAASSGHLEIVKLLISHGADVNSQSSSGNTPLMYACASGHSEIVRVLLEANANVEDHNENGHTPLMEAASAGHVEVAKILLEYGAGINTHSNEFKESALTLACYKGHLEMVSYCATRLAVPRRAQLCFCFENQLERPRRSAQNKNFKKLMFMLHNFRSAFC